MTALSARLLASREAAGAILPGDPGERGRDAEMLQIELEYLVAAGLSGALAQGRIEEVRQFESWFDALCPPDRSPQIFLQLLLDHAAITAPLAAI